MRWSLLIVLALQAAMCGQKGPLYLPDQKLIAPTAAIHGSHGIWKPAPPSQGF